MSNVPTESFIARAVAHIGGPVATAEALGGAVAYQEVQRWVARGWASPHHALSLEKHLPKGVTLRNLLDEAAKKRTKTGPKREAVRDGATAATAPCPPVDAPAGPTLMYGERRSSTRDTPPKRERRRDHSA
jgi:hypothetical protein